MSSDFSRLFGALGDAADPRRLPDPRTLRHAAERRTRTRRAAVAAVGIATALAAAVTVTLLRGAPRSEAPIGPAPSVAVAGSPSPSPVESRPASPSARPAGSDCRPADLDPRPYYDGEGAAGTAISYVIVQNREATSCRLATYPALLYTDGTSVKVLPAERIDDRQRPVLLAPGRYAQLGIARVNCPSTRDYQGMWVTLAGDERFRLPGFRLPADCGPVQLSPWTLSVFPSPVGANPTRAPAP